ncbi:MAG: glycerol kinase GlpK [Acidobacteriota bacterium]
MTDRYILALDQGTTSSRAVLFNARAEIIALAQRPFKQYYPQPGWVEHDPREIWSTQLEAAYAVLAEANITAKQVAALGLTNQRETVVLWDRETGYPLHPAIVWQCRRTAGICDELRNAGHEPIIQAHTGLMVDAYFSASKIRWLLDNIDGARAAATAGRLAIGTIDTWLLWQLSGGRRHVTDASNASRTMLFNIHKMAWDDEMLALFDVPRALLPEVVPANALIGETTVDLFGTAIPLGGIAGDQQAALFGQGCYRLGQVKNTYGTGCFVLLNTGQEAITSRQRLITTVAWQLEGELPCYALEGSVFIAGAAVQWLRDGLQIIESAAETAALATSVDDSGGVYVVPAFVGLGAPYWDQYARGAILGITRGTTRAHIVRATLESIAYQTRDLLEALRADLGAELAELRVDGGATVNDFLLQTQADLLGYAVLRPRMLESTVAGAAYLAGLACRYWQNCEELATLIGTDVTRFEPHLDANLREARYRGWRRAVERAARWEEPAND